MFKKKKTSTSQVPHYFYFFICKEIDNSNSEFHFKKKNLYGT